MNYTHVVAITTLLADILVVALSGIPFSGAQSYKGYVISTFLSTTIISIMLLVLPFAIQHRQLIRVENIMDVMKLLRNSNIMDVGSGTAEMKKSDRDACFVGPGRRYGLVERTEVDGRVSLVINEEIT